MKQFLLTFSICFSFFANTEESINEIHLLCKSKFYELETELYINTENESWIILPPSLVPDNIFSSGTKKKITKPKFTGDKITGTILIDNLLLRERFVINRKTGAINFDAYRSSFAGNCQKFSEVDSKNKF